MADLRGSDAILSDDNDLTIYKSDIAVATGEPNLQQVLSILLSTDKGDIPMNSNYGVRLAKFIGSKNSRSISHNLSQEIYDAIAKEPRIVGINYINAYPNGPNAYNVSVGLTTITGEDIQQNLIWPNNNQSISIDTNRIANELQKTTSINTLTTNYDISSVNGVYSTSDSEKTNNYYFGGSFSGRQITFGTSLPKSNISVYVDYTTKNTLFTSIDTKFIDGESCFAKRESSTDAYVTLDTVYNIYEVFGIYKATDVTRETNLYTLNQGSFFDGTAKTITLYVSLEELTPEEAQYALVVVYTSFTIK